MASFLKTHMETAGLLWHFTSCVFHAVREASVRLWLPGPGLLQPAGLLCGQMEILHQRDTYQPHPKVQCCMFGIQHYIKSKVDKHKQWKKIRASSRLMYSPLSSNHFHWLVVPIIACFTFHHIIFLLFSFLHPTATWYIVLYHQQ